MPLDAFDERQKALAAKVLDHGLDGVTPDERTEFMMGRLVGKVEEMGPVIGKAVADGINEGITHQTKVIETGFKALSGEHRSLFGKVRWPASLAGIGAGVWAALDKLTP